MQKTFPVDVISVCSAAGEIRPLRLQISTEDQQKIRVNISEIVSVRAVPYVGVEGSIFVCRAIVQGRYWMFELKYSHRSHCWSMIRRIY